MNSVPARAPSEDPPAIVHGNETAAKQSVASGGTDPDPALLLAPLSGPQKSLSTGIGHGYGSMTVRDGIAFG